MKVLLLVSLTASVTSFTTSWSRSFARTSGITTLGSTAEPPTEKQEIVREAPAAGWEPEWEDRPGLPMEEFLKSDESQPDLSGMWECPLTRWDYKG
eukprot:scaffold34690_cov288-Amphora_coffeaeformis.AAC.7